MPAATRSSGSHQTDKATTTKATTTKAASAKAKDPLAGSRKRKDRSNEDADVEIAAPTQPVSKRTARKGKAASGPTTVTPVANTSPEDEATGNPQPNVDSADLNQDAPAPPAGPSDVASTRSGPASTNPGDQDERSALVARAEALEKENRALKKFRIMWVKQQQDKNALPSESSPAVPDNSVPRPPGERGKNGWNMQTALQLEDDGDTYNAILATTRTAVDQAGLDCKKKFDKQDPGRLSVCYNQVKQVHPYLKRFRDDWACRELTLGVLQNRRKAENARARSLVAQTTSESRPASKSKRKGFKPRSKSASQQLEPSAGDSAEDIDDLEE